MARGVRRIQQYHWCNASPWNLFSRMGWKRRRWRRGSSRHLHPVPRVGKGTRSAQSDEWKNHDRKSPSLWRDSQQRRIEERKSGSSMSSWEPPKSPPSDLSTVNPRGTSLTRRIGFGQAQPALADGLPLPVANNTTVIYSECSKQFVVAHPRIFS